MFSFIKCVDRSLYIFANADITVLFNPDTLRTYYCKRNDAGYYTDIVKEFQKMDSTMQDFECDHNNNLMLRLLITNRCNLNCEYCQMRRMVNNNVMDMSIDDLDRLIDIVSNGDYEYITIHFSGGEPLIVADKIEYVCEKVKKMGLNNVRFAISTNGLLLNEKSINLLIKYDIQTVISIDGLDGSKSLRKNIAGESSVKKVLEKCSEARLKGLKFGISTVCIQSDLDNAVPLVDILHNQYGIESIGYNYQHYAGFEKRNIDVSNDYMRNYARTLIGVSDRCREYNIFEEQSNRIIEPFVSEIPRYNHCSSQVSQVTVLSDGTLGPCKTFVSDHRDVASIDSWESSTQEIKELFSKWRGRNSTSIHKCNSCPYRTVCGGGCPYEAFVDYSDIYNPDTRYCVVAETVFLHMLDLMYDKGCFLDATESLTLLTKEKKRFLLTSNKTDKLKLTTSIGHFLEN